MNDLLNKKLEQLKAANEFECWYLVKHSTEFYKQCYLASILKEYIDNQPTDNFETFLGRKVSEINSANPNIKLSNNYRALRVAAFFWINNYARSRI